MPEPVYLAIASTIEERIKTRQEGYRPGDQIPGEDILAAEFGVAPATAGQAIAQLRRRRLVRSEGRRGTFVRAVPPVRRLTADRFATAYRERGRGAADVELRDLGFQSRTEWLKNFGSQPCPGDDGIDLQPSTAELLGVEPGTAVMVRPRLMFAAPIDPDNHVDYRAEEPIQIAVSFIPADIADKAPGVDATAGRAGVPGIMVRDTGVGGLLSRLADVGHRPVRACEYVTGRPATDVEAQLLLVDRLSTVSALDRQMFDGAGRVVEVCRHVFSPEVFVLTYEYTID